MLPHLASRIFGTPLLIQRAKLDVILSVLGPRLGIDGQIHADAKELMEAIPAPRQQVQGAAWVAVIPIYGTLVRRTLGLEAASGLMSYQEISAMLDAALADPSVTGILFDIDSPGGEASGSFELARRVREATAVKPVWAVANDAAFSAAYAIAAAANRVIVTETGGVGSIGVIALHVDQSVKDANDGYRYTAITAGAHKNDFSPHEPLSGTARDELQAEVNRLYDIFVGHVAAMRGLQEKVVRDTEAALYFGPNAISAGLADAVGTLDATLEEFSTYLSSRVRNAPTARSFTQPWATRLQEDDTMSIGEIEETKEMIDADQVAALVADARSEVARSAQAIAEMCLIAGCPERAAEFIAAGSTEAEVRRALIEARAAHSMDSAVRSTHAPKDWAANGTDPAASPVVAAVKKLINKE